MTNELFLILVGIALAYSTVDLLLYGRKAKSWMEYFYPTIHKKLSDDLHAPISNAIKRARLDGASEDVIREAIEKTNSQLLRRGLSAFKDVT